MNHTPFGRSVYAVEETPRLPGSTGLDVTRVKIQVMAIVAVPGPAFAGILAGLPDPMLVQRSAAWAGTRRHLGRHHWRRQPGRRCLHSLGDPGRVVFLGVLKNGMTLLDISEYWQSAARGGLILLAVLINMAPSPKAK